MKQDTHSFSNTQQDTFPQPQPQPRHNHSLTHPLSPPPKTYVLPPLPLPQKQGGGLSEKAWQVGGLSEGAWQRLEKVTAAALHDRKVLEQLQEERRRLVWVWV